MGLINATGTSLMPLPVRNFTGRLTAIGTSHTVGLSLPASEYVQYAHLYQLAGMIGATSVRQLAQQGSTMSERTPTRPLGIASMSSRKGFMPFYQKGVDVLFLVECGTNDWLSSGAYPAYNPANFETDLDAFIKHLIGKRGWPADKILMVGPPYATADALNFAAGATGTAPVAGDLLLFRQKVQDVAAANGVRVSDPYPALEALQTNHNIYDNVGVHVLAEGHAAWAVENYKALCLTP